MKQDDTITTPGLSHVYRGWRPVRILSVFALVIPARLSKDITLRSDALIVWTPNSLVLENTSGTRSRVTTMRTVGSKAFGHIYLVKCV